jgi:hypothetical protein
MCHTDCPRTEAEASLSSPSDQEEGSGYMLHLLEDEQDDTPSWMLTICNWSPIERFRRWRCAKSDYDQRARLFRSCPTHRHKHLTTTQAALLLLAMSVVFVWLPVILIVRGCA